MSGNRLRMTVSEIDGGGTVHVGRGFAIKAHSYRTEFYLESADVFATVPADVLFRECARLRLPERAVLSLNEAGKAEPAKHTPLMFVVDRRGDVVEVWRSEKPSWRSIRGSLRALAHATGR
jgi:hypothetical protein